MTKTEIIIRILALRNGGELKWTREEWEEAKDIEETKTLAWHPNGVELEDSSNFG